jgi:tape measure domain-containing protein
MSRNPNISLSFQASAFQAEIKKMNDALKTTKKEFEVSNLAIQANGNQLDLAANKIAGYSKQAEQQRAITAKAKEAVEQSAKAYTDAGFRVEAARQAYEKVAKSENASKEELQKLKKELDITNNIYDRLGKAVQTWNNKLLDSQKAENQLKVAVKQTNDEVEKHNKALAQNAQNTRNVVTNTGNLLNVYTLLKGLAVGYAGKSLYQALIGDNAQFEQYMTSFEVLLGGIDNAEKRMQELTQFAAVTPFELPQMVQAEQRLLAYGVAVKETAKVLPMLGDISLGNAEKLDRISLAYGQVVSSQRLYGTELRQFAENGVPLLAELAKMYGVTEAEMREMVSDGKVGADAVTAALERMTSAGGKFFGMMDKQSQTMTGMLSTLKDNFGIFAREVGENSFNYLKGSLGDLTDEINRMAQSGELGDIAADWGRNIADFVSTGAEAIMVLWEMKEVLLAAGAGVVAFKTSMAISGTVMAVADALETYTTAVKAGSTATAALNAMLNVNPWVLLASAVAAVITGIIAYNVIAGDAATETDKLVEKTAELTDEYERNIKAAERQENRQLGEVEILNRLVGELDNLSQKVDKTAQDKERMAAIVDQLNIKIPNLALSINAETGELNKQIGVVQNAIEAYKQLLLVKASEKKATAAAESLLDLRDQKQKLSAELSELTKQQEELDDKNKNGSNSARGYNYDPNAFLGLIKTEQQLSKIKDSIIQTDKAIADADKAIRDSFDFSAEYTSKYGPPETDPYAPPPYTPPPLAGSDKKDVEDKAKKAFEERRKFSDMWIAEQKYYSKLTANEEIAAYERIRNYVDQYYKDGVIDYKEYQNQIRDIDKNIFTVRKNMLEDAIDDSIKAEKAGLDARKAALVDEEKNIKDSYDARKKAIEDYYDEIDREEKQQDRAEKLKELLDAEEKYENAASREGQDRLKRIRDEIKSINQDIAKEHRAAEKKKELSEVDAERDSLETERLRKLEILNEDYNKLDLAQKTILSNISDYAFISASAIEEVTKKIQTMVQEITKLQIPSGAMAQESGATPTGGGTNIHVNDYGDKIINSKDEAIDYTQELFNTALNLK